MAASSISMNFTASARNAKPQASICAPRRSCRYRRSTTHKAPRKRTFVANMTKYSDRQIHGAMVAASGAASEAATFSISACACIDNNGNNNNNGGNNNNNARKFFSGDDSNSSNNNSSILGFIPVLASVPLPVLIAANVLAFTAFSLMAPPSTNAATSQPMAIPAGRSSGSASMSSSFGTSPKMSVSAPRSGMSGTKIQYGRVALSEDERKMLGDKQYTVRETYRVY